MKSYITGTIKISEFNFSRVSDKLKFNDYLGAIMVRWGINRGRYRIDPGIYAVGNPGKDSDVFVTGNYKLSFDHLRKNLAGLDGWILVLDTKGINVWCAAGKGTFGTKELIKRISEQDLKTIVSHRKVIVPQLGATGVSAHKVREATGFNVHYGPVRAADIREFVEAGYRATPEMRKVKFGLWERLKLIPNDLIQGNRYLFIAAAIAFLISGISFRENSFDFGLQSSINSILIIFIAYITGVVIAPAFLPFLPFRMFSMKGLFAGIIISAGLLFTPLMPEYTAAKIAWFLIIPAIASFMSMNFTGSSTFTSLSGVKREMKLSLPVQIAMAAAGIILLVISWF